MSRAQYWAVAAWLLERRYPIEYDKMERKAEEANIALAQVRIRHYDARMVIPLAWDEDGLTECAFVTRAYYRGKAVDQLQMHLRGDVGLLSHEKISEGLESAIIGWG